MKKEFLLLIILITSSLLLFNALAVIEPASITTPSNNSFVKGIFNVNIIFSGISNITINIVNATSTTTINQTTNTTSPFTTLWNTTTFSDGIYDITTFIMNSSNSNDNATAINSNITIDNSIPFASIIWPTTSNNITKKAGEIVNVSYTYTEQNPSNLTIKIINQTGSEINQTFLTGLSNGTINRIDNITIPSGTAEGFYHINITIIDLAGNVNSTQQNNATIIDNPPVLLLSPANNTYDRTGNINFSCNSSDFFGLKNITINVWNSTNITYYTNFTTISSTINSSTWQLTSMPEGNYNWTCVAYDSSNLQSLAQNNTLIIDKIAPSIIISSPVSGSTINGTTITLTTAINDTNLNSSSCKYKVMEGANVTRDYTYFNCASVDISLNYSTYVIYVNASDKAGNSAGNSSTFTTQQITTTTSTTPTTATTTNVTNDTIAPTTTASAIKADGLAYTFDTWTFDYVNVTLTCSDNKNCSTTQYCLDVANTCTPLTKYSKVLQISTKGVSYIRYRSNDTKNNIETTKSQTIKIGETERKIFNITSNKTIIFESNISALRNIEISLKSNASNVSNAEIVLKKLEEKPSEISAPNETYKVHSYVKIEKSINDESISSVKIKFSLEKSWLQTNNLDKNDVVLLRYLTAGAAWQVLNTKISSEETNTINYESLSPSLSVFAISAEKKTTQEESSQEKKEKLTMIYILIAASVIFLLLGAAALIYILKKSGKEETKSMPTTIVTQQTRQ